MENSSLYATVYEQILYDIKCGEYPENSALPAERYLCEKYHVSRSTIRQALALLKNTEYVYSVQGNGTFIKPQVFIQPLTKFYSFTDTLKSSNILIQNKIIRLETISADEKLAKKTSYPVGAVFHKLLRLRSAKEYPLMLETTFLPQSRFVQLDMECLTKGSLYEYLRQKYGFHATRAAETFCPVMPRAEERELLQLQTTTPCMLLERFSYENDLLIEYTKSIVRGDKYSFHIDLQNTPDEMLPA